MGTARDEALRAATDSLAVEAATQRLDDLALDVSRAFHAIGVPHLVLRGPALASWLYDQPGERFYGDVDVLVPPDALERAVAQLQANGLRMRGADAAPGEWPSHALTFDGATGAVDLHRTVRGPQAAPEEVWVELSRDAQQLELRRGAVAVPRPAARAFLVALHAAQHGPAGRVQRADVARAVARLEPATWREAAALAARLRADTWFAAGIASAPGGEELLRALGLVNAPDRTVALRAQGRVPVAGGLLELADTRGAMPKARRVAREVVPTPSFMREWMPLARRGRRGLAAAYVARPFWLVRHLPGAVRAFRRASRDARRP